MIAFFAQKVFATGSGAPNLPNGFLFGGGVSAAHQLGVEVLGILAVVAAVFALSWVTIHLISRALGGILATRPEQTAT